MPVRRNITLNKSGIVVGKPLPFSVFDPARKLLLAAKGQVVTDAMRAGLLRTGLTAFTEDDELGSCSDETQEAEGLISPLMQLRRQYANSTAIVRAGFRMARDERSEGYHCRLLGITEHRGLILTAPATEDRSYVAISEGQSWRFRSFHATAAVRFAGIVEKVIFEPFPYLHVAVPALVEMRHIRKSQRVSVCLSAVCLDAVASDTPVEAVIVDLSCCGMRLAVSEEIDLKPAQRFRLSFRVSVLDKQYELNVQATVARQVGAADPAHPRVVFYGLVVEPDNELDRLVLHAYAQGRLAAELDVLSKLLAICPVAARTEVAA